MRITGTGPSGAPGIPGIGRPARRNIIGNFVCIKKQDDRRQYVGSYPIIPLHRRDEDMIPKRHKS